MAKLQRKAHHLSLIVKGPLKTAKRAMHRHGIGAASCRVVGGGRSDQAHDIQCYTPCSSAIEHKVAAWYAERSRAKAGRGHPPGALLYYSGSCPTDVFGRRKRRSKGKR